MKTKTVGEALNSAPEGEGLASHGTAFDHLITITAGLAANPKYQSNGDIVDDALDIYGLLRAKLGERVEE